MIDSRFQSWGQLDTAAHALEVAARELAMSWNRGEYRMKKEDCKRLAAYLSRIRVSLSPMRDTLKLFEELAQRQDGQKIIIGVIEAAKREELTRLPHEKNLQQQAT